MSSFRQMKLLIWKNFLLQWRNPIVTLFEILIPCLFVAIIAIIRLGINVKPDEDGMTYSSFDFLHLPNITEPLQKKYRLIYAPNHDLNKKIMQNLIERLNQTQFSQLFEFESMNYLFDLINECFFEKLCFYLCFKNYEKQIIELHQVFRVVRLNYYYYYYTTYIYLNRKDLLFSLFKYYE